MTSGVPQGTVVGPLMFLLFINDTQHDLECTLRLFADDALLYHKITFHDDILSLQRNLDKLGLLADRWQMLFNPSKCYKMSVFLNRSPLVKVYFLYNQTLETVQQHPYLGVLLSSDLRWNSHVDKITEKGNSSQIFHKSVHNNIALPIPPYYLLSTRESRNFSTNSFIQPSVRHDYYKYCFFFYKGVELFITCN